MSAVDNAKPVLPRATAEAETAALNAQILKTGTTQKDNIVELNQGTDDGVAETKKAPEAGLKNYFVSTNTVEHTNCWLTFNSAYSPMEPSLTSS